MQSKVRFLNRFQLRLIVSTKEVNRERAKGGKPNYTFKLFDLSDNNTREINDGNKLL